MVEGHEVDGLRAATRRAARRPSTGVLALVVAGVTGMTAGIVAVTTASPAQAAPERVLQSVAVEVGPDGRVNAISSRAVRDASGQVSEDVTDLPAAELSRELPLRVQTAWRLGDRSGTDLSDIAGESGRVVVELTVQNTTVRPRQVRYDAGGVSKSRYALVGTPLTVVASADLGEGSHGSVVMQDDLTPDAVTNGVLGRGADDSAEIQWASMLAPPRLAASATLRLVQDTDDFQPPTFDLSVQPGLVTDTSTRRLLEAAFAEESDSTLSMESRTLDLVGSVSTILLEASTVLTQIQTELGTAGRDLGAKTIGDLQASSSSISASMSGISSDLDALSGEMGTQLDASNAAAVGALKKSVDEVRGLLGDPKTQLPPVDDVDGCKIVSPQQGRNATVMAQLAAVGGQLESLAGATAACRSEITEALSETVGVVNENGVCTPMGSAACLLQDVGSALSTQLTAIENFREWFAGKFDESLVGDTAAAFEKVSAELAALNPRLFPLQNGGTGGLDFDLNGVIGSLNLVTALLDPADGPSVAENLDGIESDLRAQADALDGALGVQFGRSAVDQAFDVRSLACQPLPDTTLAPNADQISVIAVGVPCADTELTTAGPFAPGSMAARYAALAETSGDIRDLADAVNVADNSVAGIVSTVTGASESLTALLDEEDGESPELKSQVVGLVCSVYELTLRTDQIPTQCPGYTAPDPEAPPLPDAPVVQLATALDAVESNQAGLTDDVIRDAFSEATSLLATSIANAGEGAGEVAGAGGAAQQRVGGLISDLESQLDGTGRSVLVDGREVVRQQRRALDQSVGDADRKLSAAASKALRSIASDVDAANRNVGASERQLLADLRKVLVDLGERENNGTGLLGSLVTGATSAGVSDDQIRSANQTALAFGRVRSQDVEGILLEQAQTAVALRLQAEFPAFGIDLPEGSRSTTVFAYRVSPD